MRRAEINRKTKETEINLSLNLDGSGNAEVASGAGFFDHMLELFAVHSGTDLSLVCKGDTEVDFHHSAEDIGIALGSECAALVALDLSGRAYLNFECELSGKAGSFDLELVEEFLRAFCYNAGCNLYVKLLRGGNKHHEAEAVFKALARCLRDAVRIEGDKIPSSKGVL